MKEKIVTLPYYTTDDVKAAAAFIAALVETSTAVFSAEVRAGRMIVTFTGGY